MNRYWVAAAEMLSKHDKKCPTCGDMAVATVDGRVVCYTCFKSIESFNAETIEEVLEKRIGQI